MTGGRTPVPGAGLCNGCRHQRVVSGRSRFTMCLRSRDDPRYPKYPAIPVLRCAGHEAAEPPETSRAG